jgi:hypothetical protein
MNDTKACPICGQIIPIVPRYPNYVCRECVERAVSPELALAASSFRH